MQNIMWHLVAVHGSAFARVEEGKMKDLFALLGTVHIVFVCLSEMASWRTYYGGRNTMLG